MRELFKKASYAVAIICSTLSLLLIAPVAQAANNFAGCSGNTVSWGGGCTGSFGNLSHGGSAFVRNQNDYDYEGGRTAYCNDGTIIFQNSTCFRNCVDPVRKVYQSCVSATGYQKHGTTQSYENEFPFFTGSISATCDNGNLLFSGQTCVDTSQADILQGNSFVCGSKQVTWGNGCSATVPPTAAGSPTSLVSTDPNNEGIATAVCINNMDYTVSGSCSPRTTPLGGPTTVIDNNKGPALLTDPSDIGNSGPSFGPGGTSPLDYNPYNPTTGVGPGPGGGTSAGPGPSFGPGGGTSFGPGGGGAQPPQTDYSSCPIEVQNAIAARDSASAGVATALQRAQDLLDVREETVRTLPVIDQKVIAAVTTRDSAYEVLDFAETRVADELEDVMEAEEAVENAEEALKEAEETLEELQEKEAEAQAELDAAIAEKAEAEARLEAAHQAVEAAIQAAQQIAAAEAAACAAAAAAAAEEGGGGPVVCSNAGSIAAQQQVRLAQQEVTDAAAALGRAEARLADAEEGLEVAQEGVALGEEFVEDAGTELKLAEDELTLQEEQLDEALEVLGLEFIDREDFLETANDFFENCGGDAGASRSCQIQYDRLNENREFLESELDSSCSSGSQSSSFCDNVSGFYEERISEDNDTRLEVRTTLNEFLDDCAGTNSGDSCTDQFSTIIENQEFLVNDFTNGVCQGGGEQGYCNNIEEFSEIFDEVMDPPEIPIVYPMGGIEFIDPEGPTFFPEGEEEPTARRIVRDALEGFGEATSELEQVQATIDLLDARYAELFADYQNARLVLQSSQALVDSYADVIASCTDGDDDDAECEGTMVGPAPPPECLEDPDGEDGDGEDDDLDMELKCLTRFVSWTVGDNFCSTTIQESGPFEDDTRLFVSDENDSDGTTGNANIWCENGIWKVEEACFSPGPCTSCSSDNEQCSPTGVTVSPAPPRSCPDDGNNSQCTDERDAVAEAEAAVRAALEDLEDAEDAYDDAFEARLDAYNQLDYANEDIATSIDRLTDAQEALEEAEAGLSDAKDAADDAQDRYDTAEAEFAALEEQAAAAQENLTAAQDEVESAQDALDEISEDAESAEEAVREANERLDEANQAVQEVQEQVDAIQTELDAQTEALEAAENAFDEASAQQAEAQQTFDDATAADEAARQALAQAQENAQATETGLSEAQEAAEQAEQAQTEAADLVANARANLAQATEALQQQEVAYNASRERRDAADEARVLAQESNSRSQQRVEDARSNEEDSFANRTIAQEAFDAAEDDLQDAQFRQLDAEYARSEAELRLDNAEQTKASAEERLEYALEDRDQADDALVQAQGNLSSAQQRQAQAQQDVNNAGSDEERAAAQARLDQANNDVDTAQSQYNSAELSAQSAAQFVDMAQEFVQAWTDFADRANDDLAAAEDRVVSAGEAMDRAVERQGRASDRLDQANAAYEAARSTVDEAVANSRASSEALDQAILDAQIAENSFAGEGEKYVATQTALISARRDLADAEEDLTDAEEALAEAEADLQAATEASQTASGEVEQAQAAQDQAAANVVDSAEQLGRSGEAIDNASRNFDDAQESYSEVEERFNTVNAELEEANAEIEAAQLALDEAEQNLDEITGDEDSDNPTLSEAQENLREAEEALEAAQELNELAERAVADAEDALFDAEQDLMLSDSIVDMAQGEVDVAEEDIETAERALDTAQDALEDAQSAIDDAEDDVAQAQRDRRAAQDRVNTARTAALEASGLLAGCSTEPLEPRDDEIEQAIRDRIEGTITDFLNICSRGYELPRATINQCESLLDRLADERSNYLSDYYGYCSEPSNSVTRYCGRVIAFVEGEYENWEAPVASSNNPDPSPEEEAAQRQEEINRLLDLYNSANCENGAGPGGRAICDYVARELNDLGVTLPGGGVVSNDPPSGPSEQEIEDLYDRYTARQCYLSERRNSRSCRNIIEDFEEAGVDIPSDTENAELREEVIDDLRDDLEQYNCDGGIRRGVQCDAIINELIELGGLSPNARYDAPLGQQLDERFNELGCSRNPDNVRCDALLEAYADAGLRPPNATRPPVVVSQPGSGGGGSPSSPTAPAPVRPGLIDLFEPNFCPPSQRLLGLCDRNRNSLSTLNAQVGAANRANEITSIITAALAANPSNPGAAIAQAQLEIARLGANTGIDVARTGADIARGGADINLDIAQAGLDLNIDAFDTVSNAGLDLAENFLIPGFGGEIFGVELPNIARFGNDLLIDGARGAVDLGRGVLDTQLDIAEGFVDLNLDLIGGGVDILSDIGGGILDFGGDVLGGIGSALGGLF